MIKRLDAYNRNAKGTYKGISKIYYPRWQGWELLEKGADYLVLEKAVEDFYMAYYWYSLKLDLLDNEELAFCLFNFAVENGKGKCTQKLQKATNSSSTGATLILELNSISSTGIYKILLEFCDFYVFIGKLNAIPGVIATYNCL